MRFDRIGKVLFEVLFACAVAGLASPAAFAQTPYDGLWHVTIFEARSRIAIGR